MKKLDIEEHNAQVFAKNSGEMDDIFEKGLQSDGGDYWVNPESIIEALTEKGYVIFKLDTSALED